MDREKIQCLPSENDIREMVDWKNIPTLKDLKDNLTEATPSHNNHVSTVNDYISTLRGELRAKIMEGRSKVQPKLVRKQGEWRYSALEEPFLSTSDMFKVSPVTHADVESARQNELILNKQFRVDIPKVKLINRLVRTAVNTGTVIIKLGWETEKDTVIEEVPVFTKSLEETYEVLTQMVQAGQISEEESIQILESGQPIQIGVESVEIEKEVINRPVVQIRDSRNVIIDPSCEGDIDNAQFIIDKFTTDLSSLKKDGRYHNLDKIEEKNYATVDDTYYHDNDYKSDPSFRFTDKPRKKLVAYEYWGYWDIDDSGIVKPIVVTWVGDTIIRLEENPFPDKKLPFVVIQYLPPDNETIYGDSDASLLKDNQDIIGAVSRATIDLIGRSANAQRGVRKDLLDPINRDKFNKGLDYEFNPINNPKDAIVTSKLPEIPRSALEVIQLQNNEAEALTGVKAFTGGISGDALGSSVGGVRSALDATAKRELGILRRLSEGIKQVGRKIITMNAVWLADEEIIRITDSEFVNIKRSALAGNFDLSLEVSTAEMDNQKAGELSFMLQTTGNTLPFDITKIILCKIADLRKLPDLSKMIQDYTPQPDPFVQEKNKLEIELLKAQINNENAKAQENIVDVQLKAAKTQAELAKARLSGSKADEVDLNYLEQSSGLKQERALESQLMGTAFKDRISTSPKESE